MKEIAYITAYSVIIPVLTGIYKIKDLCQQLAKVFYAYLVFTLVIELVASYLASHGINNHFWYNLLIFGTGLFNGFFVTNFTRNKVALGLCSLLIIYLLFNFIENPLSFNKLNCIITYLFQGVAAILILYSSSDTFDKPYYLYFDFWFYAGILIYSCTTITMYLLFDYIVERKDSNILQFYNYYQLATNLIVNIFYTKAILCLKRM